MVRIQLRNIALIELPELTTYSLSTLSTEHQQDILTAVNICIDQIHPGEVEQIDTLHTRLQTNIQHLIERA